MVQFRLLCVIALAALVAGCATHTRHEASGYKVGSPYRVAGVLYTPKEQPDYNKVGLASWYGPGFHGNHTANGEIYDQWSLTAAHATLPMPVNVRVTNLENGRSLVVRVNDRGPFHPGRIIDVSARAAELLGFKEKGTTRVRVEYIGRADRNPYTMEASGGAQRAAPTTRVASAPPHGSSKSAGMAPVPNPGPSMAPIADPPLTVASTEAPAPTMAPVADPVTSMAPIADAPPDVVQAPNPSVENAPLTRQSTVQNLAAEVAPSHMLSAGKLYVQVGAYTDSHSAMNLYNQVLGIGKAQISPTDAGGQRVYRVRLGPVADADEASRLTANLKAHGHDGVQIVME